MKQLLNLFANIKRVLKRNKAVDANQDTFSAICDIFYYSIKSGDEKVAETISKFMYVDFDRIRTEQADQPVIFPTQHYQLTYKLTQLLVKNDNTNFRYIENRATGGLWLLGEREGYKISESTYTWLWRNLKTAVEYKDQDMIMAFWMNAHQYITFQLAYIQEEYAEGKYPVEIRNQVEVDGRKNERNRFLQFTTALGGLLLYSKLYNTIQRCFRYTQSTPAKYELLPKRMDDVFERYIHFRDPYSDNYSFMGSVYSFPNIEGLNEDGLIKRYICKYIALLFLRQYSLQVYYSFQKPLAYPDTSFTQGELKTWIENIDFFRLLVEEVYRDRQLLDEVGFGWLTDEWLTQNEKPRPLQFIDDFKKLLEQKFDTKEKTQEISKEKVGKFLNSTKETLERTFKEYDKLSNKEPLSGDVEKGYIFGEITLLDKSVFADEQGVDTINFDSIFANMVSERVKDIIANSFFIHKTVNYLLSLDDVFRAIDKLNIGDDKYVLIAFGLNFNYLIHDLKIEGLSKTKYKELEIRHFVYANPQTVANTIFVIKKDDLPRLEYLDTDDVEKKKYGLETPINDTFKLYANVIDLYQKDDLRSEEETNAGEDLSKKVLAYIAFKLEIQWQKNINCISLGIYSEYQNKGIPNKLSDVKPIKEDKKNSKKEKDDQS